MTESVVLPPPAPDLRAALDAAAELESAERTAALGDIVRTDPVCLHAWARLSEAAYLDGDDVAAYAYARVGYHRGLDLLRSAGWRPDREVHWDHDGNRGFLLALYGLMRAAAAIGEGVEARRCREFLLQLDPADSLEVGRIAPRDLGRRLGS